MYIRKVIQYTPKYLWPSTNLFIKKLHIFVIVYKTAPQITAEIFFQVKFPLFRGKLRGLWFFSGQVSLSMPVFQLFPVLLAAHGGGKVGTVRFGDLVTKLQRRYSPNSMSSFYREWNAARELFSGFFNTVQWLPRSGSRSYALAFRSPISLLLPNTYSQEKWEHIQSLLLTKMKL